MKRMQIYLDNKQYENLIVASKKAGKTMSELIREAVNYKFGIANKNGFNEAVDLVAGLWKNRKGIKSGINYVNDIRKDNRVDHLYKNRSL